ncbi:MAG TPA: type II secretion system F family protein [Verrucomicrobiae bacterium]|nr:type II secretion system F family protein [Verrucomicrobiae bacterium]
MPLEGGLHQLCDTMTRGPLRAELRLLERDLAAGVPLAKAVALRKLPEFYIRLLELGARGNDLPGVLTMLADYYENAGAVWTQLKGLMVYPAIVLVLSLAFSAWAAVLGHQFASLLGRDRNLLFGTRSLSTINGGLRTPFTGSAAFPYTDSYLWVPPVMLAAVALPMLAAVTLPFFRRRIVWRLPAFREASLCRVASALAVLLRAGAALPDALALVEQMQRGTPARRDLALWKKRCSEGAGKFSAVAAGSKVFPPMFVWLVAGAGEDLASGFDRAARVYKARFAYRTNVLLYAALPVSLLFIGLMILSQIYPMGRLIFELPRLLFMR